MASCNGLVLDLTIIKKIFRSDAMKESVTYQEILLECEVKSKAKGKAEGKIEERTQIALNMPRSGLELSLIAQLTGLTVKQIQKLQ